MVISSPLSILKAQKGFLSLLYWTSRTYRLFGVYNYLKIFYSILLRGVVSNDANDFNPKIILWRKDLKYISSQGTLQFQLSRLCSSGHILVSKNVISDQESANSNKHEWSYKVYLHMQLWKDLCFWHTVNVVEYDADAASI